MPNDNSKLVYSTAGAVPRKEKTVTKSPPAHLCHSRHNVTVRLDRKARGGKSVTIIEGLQMQQNEKEALLKQLKATLGTGGTVRNTSLEIQGDHRNHLIETLGKMGYRPKRSGG